MIEMATKDGFAAALRDARVAANMSQADLGRAVDVSGARIGQWEAGDPPPDPDVVFRLEVALDLRGGDLSRGLGYIPVDGACTVLGAIETDPGLSAYGKQALRIIYREMLKRD